MTTVALADRTLELTDRLQSRYRTDRQSVDWFKYIRGVNWDRFDQVLENDKSWRLLIYGKESSYFDRYLATDYDQFRTYWREFRAWTAVLNDTRLSKRLRRYAYGQLRQQLLALVNTTLVEPYHANSSRSKGRTLLVAIVLDKSRHQYDVARALGEVVGVSVDVYDSELSVGLARFCCQLIAENQAPRYIYRRAQEFLHRVSDRVKRPLVETPITNHELHQANHHLLKLYLSTEILAPIRTAWSV